MAEPTIKIYTAQARILYEIVLFRHLAADKEVFSGEAALMLERDERSGLLRSLHVTLLSVFNGAGEEVYVLVSKNPALQRRLEAVAVEQYYHPLEEPIMLPWRVMEW
ncbi:MAG: hypothetical protein ABIO24_01820 [Saprospiraceae bacterium]